MHFKMLFSGNKSIVYLHLFITVSYFNWDINCDVPLFSFELYFQHYFMH